MKTTIPKLTLRKLGFFPLLFVALVATCGFTTNNCATTVVEDEKTKKEIFDCACKKENCSKLGSKDKEKSEIIRGTLLSPKRVRQETLKKYLKVRSPLLLRFLPEFEKKMLRAEKEKLVELIGNDDYKENVILWIDQSRGLEYPLWKGTLRALRQYRATNGNPSQNAWPIWVAGGLIMAVFYFLAAGMWFEDIYRWRDSKNSNNSWDNTIFCFLSWPAKIVTMILLPALLLYMLYKFMIDIARGIIHGT